MNFLQRWLNQLRGKEEPPAESRPDSGPNARTPEDEYRDERQAELLEKHERRMEEGDSDTGRYER
jgi:hypothetical protein